MGGDVIRRPRAVAVNARAVRHGRQQLSLEVGDPRLDVLSRGLDQLSDVNSVYLGRRQKGRRRYDRGPALPS